MRSLRHVEFGGQFFEITTRAMHSRLLMRPSKRVNELILGILGRALARFPGIKLFGFIFLSNHYHMLLWAPDQEVLSAFMSYVNGLIARKIGRLHEWSDRFWSRRFEDIVVLDEEALIGRLEYLLENGVKEGLVASPYEWPGATCVRALTHGERLVGVWEDASAAYRARRAKKKAPEGAFRSEVEFRLEPIPAWKDLPAPEQQARVRETVRKIESRGRERNETVGRSPLGATRILRQHPHDRPATTKQSTAPWCHATSFARRVAYCAFLAELHVAYRAVSIRIREGDFDAFDLLPEGCHAPPLRSVARTQFLSWKAVRAAA